MRAALLALALVAGSCTGNPDEPCRIDPGDFPDGPAVVSRIETGPLFLAAVAHYGEPSVCDGGARDGALRLSYRFPGGGVFEATVDPRLELEREAAILDGLDRKGAIDLLREAERHAFGPAGCGIDWAAPTERTEEGEEVFRGDACQCQGRFRPLGDGGVRVSFASAC